MVALDARSRRDALTRLADPDDPIDVLVVGGGITGAGVALDAATRGLRVALVEAHDLAFGTSRWSSKLVHGGLRYLVGGHLAIARESAVERHHLMTVIAPHLIRPVPQVIPDHGARVSSTMVRAGLRAGDLLRRTAGTSSTVLAPPVRLGVDDTLELCPAVRRTGLRGSIVGTDGQLVDDARLVVAVARTAAAFGATIATYTRAEQVTGTGARLTDTRTGESFDVTARAVVNATGVWAGDLDPSLRVRPSRGTHLVFDAATFGHPTGALTVPVAGSVSRFVFALPEQLDRVYVGLTDVDAPGPIPDVPEPDDAEIDFLIGAINRALEQPVTRADVIGSFAGLRPLIDSGRHVGRSGGRGAGTADLADVSRRHRVHVSDGTLVGVIGGKLTTYRRMAEDAVDAAIAASGLRAGRCVTTTTPLIGAAAVPADRTLPASMVARFGSEASKVVASATVDRPLAAIAGGLDVTRAEVEYAVTHEGAITVDDVVHRRTRIGLVDADADLARGAVTEIVDAALDALD
ncbi:glycerol-3-phosphate dehydrogenase/oxidase [Gordonia rhizosphera]|uniref:Glycerol-3-phosphate dehydrogenase n=1 Tax=Gordonia rhizosphera NBRC 16068 TaxID=1108045 RepID=K6W0W2_9ACTN|nr:glycerol-3-phosphate dehydrogenase/oxidase [Gordonia rhizosphera]GAB92785.1 glycerol-3-phosphate dehydrogenase [Gordonia rhizosphera NBRC 16068]